MKGAHGLALLLFSFVWILPSYAGSNSEFFCRQEHLPTIQAGDAPVVNIQDHTFVYGFAHARGGLTLRNESQRNIESITIIATYYDARGSTVIAIPFTAAMAGVENAYPGAAFPYYDRRLEQPLAPSKEVYISGASDFVAATCPRSAAVSLLAIRYHDGSATQWTAPDWYLAPRILEVPQYFSLPRTEVAVGDLHFTLRIDARGNTETLQGLGESDRKLSGQLLKQFRIWRIAPALKKGQPVASEMPVMMRIHGNAKRGSCAIRPEEVPTPVVVIDLVPGLLASDGWRAYAGCRGASATLRYRR
jgi:hypothetical protein